MLLISIEDINPTEEECIKMAQIGCSLGVMDMRQAFMILEPYYGHDGQQAMFVLTPETYLDTARVIFAFGVFNYASLVHESFEIPSMETGLAMKFKRQYPIEECKRLTDTYFLNLMTILGKYKK